MRFRDIAAFVLQHATLNGDETCHVFAMFPAKGGGN